MHWLDIFFLGVSLYTIFLSGAFTASLLADNLLEKRNRFATAMLGGLSGIGTGVWIYFEHLDQYLSWVEHFARYVGLGTGWLITNVLIGILAGLTTALVAKVAETIRNRR